MAYQTGSAADATALRLALTTFATANGWAWDATHEILSLGNVVCNLTAPSSGELRILGGTGVDVNGVLLSPGAGYCRIKDLGTAKPITWPVIYHLFVNTSPNDIVCLINFDASYWQWLGLGQCTNLGVPGTAAWYGASIPVSDPSYISISAGGSSYAWSKTEPLAPFWSQIMSNDYGPESSSFLHVNIDGADDLVHQWACDNSFGQGSFFWSYTPLLERQPNAWNSAAILLPARIVMPRPSSLYSYVAEMPHVRLLRINNYNGGDLITLGPDTWFVAPFFRKNTAGQTNIDSGTFGWAIRQTP